MTPDRQLRHCAFANRLCQRLLVTVVALMTGLGICMPVALATVVWRGDFQTGNLSQWDAQHIVSADRFRVVPLAGIPTGQSNAAQVTVRQGDDPINASGNRNELVKFDGASEGTEFYYGWSTLWPNTYPMLPAWQVFMQWHHPGSNGAPPVRFVLGCSAADCGTPLPDTMFFIVDGQNVWTKQPVTRGQWHRFVLHIKWSANASVGFVELWYDGVKVVPKRFIRTLFSAADTNYMKMGLYRDESIAPEGVLFQSGVVQATTLADVSQPSASIVGTHDALTTSSIGGWACDPNNAAPAQVRLYREGGVLIGTVSADQPGETAIGSQCGGNANRRFNLPVPAALNDGNPHTVHAYAISPAGSTEQLLSGSPKTLVPATCHQATASNWRNVPLGTAATGTVTVEADVTPPSVPASGAIALAASASASGDWDQLAATVLFDDETGQIRVRNGAVYAADAVVTYAANMAYRVRMVVNIPQHTYSAYVTPRGGSEVRLANNYAFRSTQQAVNRLDTWVVAAGSGAFSLIACNLSGGGSNDDPIFDDGFESDTPVQSTDPNGVRQIYPTRSGMANSWTLGFDDWQTRIRQFGTVTGTGKNTVVQKSGQVRMTVAAENNACEGETNHALALSQGFMCTAKDWKNFEMTGYFKLNTPAGSTDDMDWTMFGNGGRHPSTGDGCTGSAYKASYHYRDADVRFAKESWHVNYDFFPDGSWRSLPDGVNYVTSRDRWLGMKLVRYEFLRNGQRGVRLEQYLDLDGIDANGNPANHWSTTPVLVREDHPSTPWGSNGGECGVPDQQIMFWAGPWVTWRWDNTDSSLRLMSVREIVPPPGTPPNP